MKRLERRATPVSLTGRLLQRLPGGRFAQEQIERIEHRVLRELRQRLDGVDSEQPLSVVAFSWQQSFDQRDAIGEVDAAAHLRGLLEQSLQQSREQARQAWCAMVVKQLLPDEARLLAALSDHSTFPVIDVLAAPRLGVASRPMLENCSSIGKSAGIGAVELTSCYLRRLHAFGLLCYAPEDGAMKLRYEMLEADERVRHTIERNKKSGLRTTIVRRTVTLSDLGRTLWSTCGMNPAETGGRLPQGGEPTAEESEQRQS